MGQMVCESFCRLFGPSICRSVDHAVEIFAERLSKPHQSPWPIVRDWCGCVYGLVLRKEHLFMVYGLLLPLSRPFPEPGYCRVSTSEKRLLRFWQGRRCRVSLSEYWPTFKWVFLDCDWTVCQTISQLASRWRGFCLSENSNWLKS